MKIQHKISKALLGAIIVLTSCQQNEEPVKADQLQDQDISLKEIASRLNAVELDASKLSEVSAADEEGSRVQATETIRFDDGGVCDLQNAAGKPGCTTGIFDDPVFSYFFTLDKAYFFAHQSLGPGKGLAEAGDQFYTVFDLSDPSKNHKLASMSGYWVKYAMSATSSSKKVYFDLHSFNIQGNSVTVWFLKDGVWYWWSSLSPATHNVAAYTKGITEFYIKCASTSLFHQYKLDDVVVSNVEER